MQNRIYELMRDPSVIKRAEAQNRHVKSVAVEIATDEFHRAKRASGELDGSTVIHKFWDKPLEDVYAEAKIDKSPVRNLDNRLDDSIHYEPKVTVEAPRFEFSGLTVDAKASNDREKNKNQIKTINQLGLLKQLESKQRALRERKQSELLELEYVAGKLEEMGSNLFVSIKGESNDVRTIILSKNELLMRERNANLSIKSIDEELYELREEISKKLENLAKADVELIHKSGHACYNDHKTYDENGEQYIVHVMGYNGETRPKGSVKILPVKKRKVLTLSGDSSKPVEIKAENKNEELKFSEYTPLVTERKRINVADVEVRAGKIGKHMPETLHKKVRAKKCRSVESIVRSVTDSRTDLVKGENVRHLTNTQIQERHDENSQWTKDVESVMAQPEKGYVKKQGGSPKSGGVVRSKAEKIAAQYDNPRAHGVRMTSINGVEYPVAIKKGARL